jgi:hypothetical protein
MKLDKDKLLVSSSALATFRRYMQVKSISEFVGKELDTVTDESGYLIFKAY